MPSLPPSKQLAALPGEPLVFPLEVGWTPWAAMQRLGHLRFPLLLESSLAHPTLGRYSFVMADPVQVWSDRMARGVDTSASSCWQAWMEALQSYRLAPLPDLPPFQGGLAGWVGYELAHSLEKIPFPRWDDGMMPDYCIGLYDWVLAFDHLREQSWIIASGWPGRDAKERQHRARQRVEQVRQWLNAGSGFTSDNMEPTQQSGRGCPNYPVPGVQGVCSNFSREGYLQAIERVLEYIRAGDCFQVNLAQRLRLPAHWTPLQVYAHMRERNPSPFGGLMLAPEWAVISASPERFLQAQASGVIETRPIKGTRSRGTTPASDHARAVELVQSPKDRAENIMIVDLLRNDLGRSCVYGSVQVKQLCQVESFPTVHHLVSVVQGQLRPDCSAMECFQRAYPGGSITGAPKVRAMEIITELEPTVRGPYCGSMGYWSFTGAMDTNILIRTVTSHQGYWYFPVGGGIVADSDPESEYEETLHKAAGWLRTLSKG